MADEREENRYTDELQRISTNTEPSSDAYDRILQSVLAEIGKPGAASYTDARQRVDRLSNLRIIHTVRRVVLSKTGAMVIAAGLLLTILVGRSMSADEIVVIPDGEVPMINGPPVSGQLPQEDRQYYIAESVPMVPGDLEAGRFPSVESYLAQDDILRIYLKDNGFGIAWEKLHARNLDGELVRPVELDEERSMIGFALPADSFVISLEDDNGNQMLISVTAY